jgi:hypothetical protein
MTGSEALTGFLDPRILKLSLSFFKDLFNDIDSCIMKVFLLFFKDGLP